MRWVITGFGLVYFITALILIFATPSHAATDCLFLCKIRHPVKTWEFKHHLAHCHSVHCEEKERVNTHNPYQKRQHNGVYPCIVRWTYDAIRWWHLTYGPQGPYGANHVGIGPHNYRRCL